MSVSFTTKNTFFPKANSSKDEEEMQKGLELMTGHRLSGRCCASMTTLTCISFALFVIGCIGASGKFAGGPAGLKIGQAAIGLSVVSFALLLSLGNHKKNKWSLIATAISTATFITLGALGASGVLSAKQVGWGILGTGLAGSLTIHPIATTKDLKIRSSGQ